MDDEPDAHHEVVAQIRQDLIEAHARRQLLAEWTRESQEQSGRMRDVWALSEVAVERLGRMSFGQRQQVLALLDLRVTVLDPRTEGPARGGFQGELGPARPRIHIKGSVPHGVLLDMMVAPGYRSSWAVLLAHLTHQQTIGGKGYRPSWSVASSDTAGRASSRAVMLDAASRWRCLRAARPNP